MLHKREVARDYPVQIIHRGHIIPYTRIPGMSPCTSIGCESHRSFQNQNVTFEGSSNYLL